MFKSLQIAIEHSNVDFIYKHETGCEVKSGGANGEVCWLKLFELENIQILNFRIYQTKQNRLQKVQSINMIFDQLDDQNWRSIFVQIIRANIYTISSRISSERSSERTHTVQQQKQIS